MYCEVRFRVFRDFRGYMNCTAFYPIYTQIGAYASTGAVVRFNGFFYEYGQKGVLKQTKCIMYIVYNILYTILNTFEIAPESSFL
jgi:hypothetical protein